MENIKKKIIKKIYNFNGKPFTTLNSLTRYINVEHKNVIEKQNTKNLTKDDVNFLINLNNAKNELSQLKKDNKAIGDKKRYNNKAIFNKIGNFDFEPSYNKTHEERKTKFLGYEKELDKNKKIVGQRYKLAFNDFYKEITIDIDSKNIKSAFNKLNQEFDMKQIKN